MVPVPCVPSHTWPLPPSTIIPILTRAPPSFVFVHLPWLVYTSSAIQAGGMLRHLRSLRRMDHVHGWIHTLLEEAENERMHLLTFIRLKQPGPLFRLSVVATQVSHPKV